MFYLYFICSTRWNDEKARMQMEICEVQMERVSLKEQLTAAENVLLLCILFSNYFDFHINFLDVFSIKFSEKLTLQDRQSLPVKLSESVARRGAEHFASANSAVERPLESIYFVFFGNLSLLENLIHEGEGLDICSRIHCIVMSGTNSGAPSHPHHSPPLQDTNSRAL